MRDKYDKLNALVLGAGLSGEWAARLLLSRGCTVTVMDEGESNLRITNCKLEVKNNWKGGLPDDAFDVCVASPAFALNHPWIVACAERNIPVISELELGAYYWRGKILAITGSKGKSSLVKFCADTLNSNGEQASPAGNYGIPLCQLVLENSHLKWAVTEVSSFQMEHSPTFHPTIAILLNLQPDHLDRHGTMEEYRAMKFRMFANMGEGDYALLPHGFDAEGVMPVAVPCHRFGADVASDWRYAEHTVAGPSGLRVACDGAWFDNDVLGPAAAAGVAALLRAGVSVHTLEDGLKNFRPLAHRMQTIGVDARGVTWVDDSKATSLTALAAALRMARKPVRLIAGGVLKENDLIFLKEVLVKTTKKVYLIGQCAGQMADAWAPVVSCEICGTIERAVSMAAQEAQPSESVLLSPGTASFDQFSGYRERGERFTQLVRRVAGL